MLVTLGNRCLIRKSKPFPFHSLKILACLHLFTLNIKGGIGWLRPCDAERRQCARTERRDPRQQRGMWAALHPSCIHMYVVYMGHLRLEQLINAQLYLSISSTFFLIHEEPAEVQGMLLSRLDWAAVHVSNSTKYMAGRDARGFGLWGDLFECLTVPLAVHLTVGHSWLFSVQEWGSFRPAWGLSA